MTRNFSLVQIEQMVMAVLSGQYDAQLLQTAQPSGSTQHQQSDFGNVAPIFGFQTPFGTFPLPAVPPVPMPIPTIIGTYPPPATVVPNMFPTNIMQADPLAPNVQSTRTTFPGGETIQQSSSYSGQHGSTNFQYTSSSTSTSFSPIVQHAAQAAPPAPIGYVQQPALPTIASLQQVSTSTVPAPSQSQSYMQRLLEPQINPQPQFHSVQTPIVELPPVPEQIFHPTTINQAPQNRRLADSFKRELSEATYFSDMPGMPDRSVQR